MLLVPKALALFVLVLHLWGGLVEGIDVFRALRSKLDPATCPNIKYGFELECLAKSGGDVLQVPGGKTSNIPIKISQGGATLINVVHDWQQRTELSTYPFPVGAPEQEVILRVMWKLMNGQVMSKVISDVELTVEYSSDVDSALKDKFLNSVWEYKDIQISFGAPISTYLTDKLRMNNDALYEEMISGLSSTTLDDATKTCLMMVVALGSNVEWAAKQKITGLTKNFFRYLPRVSLDNIKKCAGFKNATSCDLDTPIPELDATITKYCRKNEEGSGSVHFWLGSGHRIDAGTCSEDDKTETIVVLESRFEYTDINANCKKLLQSRIPDAPTDSRKAIKAYLTSLTTFIQDKFWKTIKGVQITV